MFWAYFVEAHHLAFRPPALVDKGSNLPGFRKEAVPLSRPVAGAGGPGNHRVHLVDYRADLLFLAHALASFTRIIASAASPITTAATSIVQIGSLGKADFMIVPITVATRSCGMTMKMLNSPM